MGAKFTLHSAAIFTILISSASQNYASAAETVVVLPTAHSSNIRANEASSVSRALTNALNRKGFQTWGRKEIDVRLGFENVTAMGDCFSEDCTKSIAEALDAKAVIVSRINRLGNNYILVLFNGDRSGATKKVSVKGSSVSNCANQVSGLIDQLFGNAPPPIAPQATRTPPKTRTPVKTQSGTPKIGLGLQPGTRMLLGRTLQGLTVTQVVPGGLAANAGIKVGDYITKLNNVPVPDVATFGAILKSANGTLIAQVVKINAMVAVPVTLLGSAPVAAAPSAAQSMPAPATPAVTSSARPPRLGLGLRFMTKNIAGLNVKGMEVTKVQFGSNGAKAGFQRGDFIRELNGQPINSSQDFKRIYKSAKNQLTFVYVRNGVFGPQRAVIPYGATSVSAPPSSAAPAAAGQWSGSGNVQFGNQNTATNNQAPQSKTTNDYSLGKGGIGFSTETITRNTEPIDSATLGTWNLGWNTSLSDSSTSIGFLAGVGFRNLDPSGYFPGPEGGSRGALDIRLSANAMFQMTSIDFGSSFGSFDSDYDSSSSIELTNLNLLGQAGLAYTSLSFDPLDEETMTQSGFGWSIGLGLSAIVNLSSSNSNDDDYDSSNDYSSSSSYEPDAISFAPVPIVGIEFPKLNPGTASLSSFQISGFILPFGGLSAALNLGGSF